MEQNFNAHNTNEEESVGSFLNFKFSALCAIPAQLWLGIDARRKKQQLFLPCQ